MTKTKYEKRTKILNKEELRRFKEETKVNANHVFITQEKNKYYVVLVDCYLKLEIKKELALQFL